jgi:hypothetical protein
VVVLLTGSRPAFAQVDLTGIWANKRLHENNSEEAAVGDNAGIPLTSAARQRAESWSASRAVARRRHRAHGPPHRADSDRSVSHEHPRSEIGFHCIRSARQHT